MKTLKTIIAVATLVCAVNGCADEDITGSDEQNATAEAMDINAKAKSGGEVEIWRSLEDDQFYFHLQAKNGELVLQSEGYESLDGAQKGARTLKTLGQNKLGYTLRKKSGKTAKWYFTIGSANGEKLAVSETYDSKTKAITGAKTAMGLLRGNTMLDHWTDQCGFEMYVGDDDDIWFRLRAENGEPILKSEGYSTEKSAKTAIDTVVTTSLIAEGTSDDLPAYEVFEGDDGQYYWNLVAANNEVVASGGEGFETALAARKSVELVKDHANEEAACWTVDAPAALKSE